MTTSFIMRVMWTSLFTKFDSNYHPAPIILILFILSSWKIQGPKIIRISFNIPSYPKSRRRLKRLQVTWKHTYIPWYQGNMIRWGVKSLTSFPYKIALVTHLLHSYFFILRDNYPNFPRISEWSLPPSKRGPTTLSMWG